MAGDSRNVPPESTAADRDDADRVSIERMVAGGDGLARLTDGRVVFVPGTIGGEEVDVAVTDRRRDWARGRLVAVRRPSPDRIEPTCPRHHAGCGGCDWRHLDASAQLPTKIELVREAFARTGGIPDVTLLPGGTVPADGYRTTARVAGDELGRAGFRAARSDAVVAATGCLVAAPPLRALVDDVRVDPGTEVTLRVSLATGEATASWSGPRRAVRGLPEHVAVGRDAALIEQVDGHRLRVSARSFFQSGPAAAELLVAAVRRAAPELGDARAVVDAYAGVGLFAVAAVPESAHVVVVEASRSAVADARSNLEHRSHRVVRADVDRWVGPRDGPPVDVVIADPSRRGLGAAGVAALVAPRAPVLVLVSCDPVSAARDASLLREAGYDHDGADVVDLFPWTHHVEVVSRFVEARRT